MFVVEDRFPCSVTFTSSVCPGRQVSMQFVIVWLFPRLGWCITGWCIADLKARAGTHDLCNWYDMSRCTRSYDNTVSSLRSEPLILTDYPSLLTHTWLTGMKTCMPTCSCNKCHHILLFKTYLSYLYLPTLRNVYPCHVKRLIQIHSSRCIPIFQDLWIDSKQCQRVIGVMLLN